MIICFIQVHKPYLALWGQHQWHHICRGTNFADQNVYEESTNWNPPKDAHGKYTAVVRKYHHRHSYHSSHWCTDQYILSAKNPWDAAQTLYHSLLYTVIQCTHMIFEGFNL